MNVARVEGAEAHGHPGAVAVSFEVQGKAPMTQLAAELGEIDGVISVGAGDVSELPE